MQRLDNDNKKASLTTSAVYRLHNAIFHTTPQAINIGNSN